jgi:tagatose-1,6-bisphosphate aldolase
MRELTPGKIRGLQQCSTSRGTLAVLALDHRNNLRQALNPADPPSVRDVDLSTFKVEVTRALSPAASAVLLDPEFGAFQVVDQAALPGAVGLVVAIEATGYTGDPAARESKLLDRWSVAKAKRMGASAVKLLVYYNPKAPTAPAIEQLVAQVADDCTQQDIPLMLEPLSYPIDSARRKLVGDERRDVVIETARRLTAIGGDILKAEFPLDIDAHSDSQVWEEACAELTLASTIPWVLLSASVDYPIYLRQTIVACQQGASGVAAGRAVWKESSQLQGGARRDFLLGAAFERMQRLTSLVDALAAPWMDRFQLPDADPKSYQVY